MSDPAADRTIGYSTTTKVLHWATIGVLLAQLVVGYSLDFDDDPAEEAREARAERLEQRADRNDAGEDALDARADALEDAEGGGAEGVVGQLVAADEPLLTVHVTLGLTVLLLGVVRLVRRRVVPLPPWAEQLSGAERRWEHRTEQALHLALVVMPLSGLGVLFVDDGILPVHIASHVLLYAALAAHVGLVLKHQVVQRDGLLRRML